MAKGDEITTKFKVDISDLKKGITEANNQIKLANAQFKAATSGLDSWKSSIEGVKAKLTQLSTTLTAQKSKLSSLKEELSRTSSENSKISSSVDQLKAKLQELANNGVSKTSAEYKKYANELAAAEKAQAQSEKSIDNLNQQIALQEAAIQTTEGEITKYSSTLNTLEKESQEAAESTKKQESAYDGLKSKIDEQQAKLDELKTKYASVVLEQGKNSDSAKELAGEIDELSGELKDNKTALSEADEAADDLDQSLDDLDPEETASGFTVLKGALANLVADGIRLAVDAIKDFAKETIEVGKNFDSSMSNVAALSGATGEELQMLRDTAKEFGSSTQFSASEAADALGYMALAGWDANQSASALGGVLDLAAASGMGLAEASDMVTDYMSAFNMEADQSTYFADLLAYAQANANTTAAGLGEAFKNCAANMNAAGQDIETTTSLLSMMANQGLKGSEAGTALTAVMRDMTAKMQDGAIAIGDTQVQVMDANGNYRDMTDILLDVESAVNGMGDAERAAALSSTFTSDSIKGLNLILNAGVGEAAAFEEELRNSSGAASDMAAIMNDNLGGDLTALNSKLEGVQIALYEKLEPALRSGVDALSSLLDAVMWVVDHSDGFIAAIAAMAAGLGAYFAYTTAIQIMKNGWMSLAIVQKAVAAAQAVLNAVMAANPIGIIIGLIAALVAAFVVLWNKSESFRNFWLNLWDNIKNAVQPVIDTIVSLFTGAWDLIKSAWEGVTEFFTNVWEGIKLVFSTVGEWFSEKFTAAKEGISNAWATITEWFTEKWAAIQEVFATVDTWFSEKFGAAWDAIKLVWDTVVSYFQLIWENIKLVFSVVGDVLTGDFSGAWEGIKQIWQNVSDWFNERWTAIKEVFAPVTKWFSDKFTAAKKAVTDVWNNIATWFSNKWNGIKTALASVNTWFKQKFQAAKDAVTNAWNNIVTWFTEKWNGIKSALSSVNTWFSEKFTAAKNAVTNAWSSIVNWFSEKWNGIKNVFSSVGTWFGDKFGGAWTAIKNKFASWGSYWSGLWTQVKDKFSSIGTNIADAISGAVKSGINSVIGLIESTINKAVGLINGAIGLINKLPGVNVGSVSTVSLPRLAKGGVLKRGQVGLLEGNGAEAVVPLDQNKAWIRAVANDMLKQINNVSSAVGVGSSMNTSNVNNFTQNIYAPKQPSRIELYRQTRNLLAYVKGGG